MTYVDKPVANPAHAHRDEMRRRAAGVAGLAVRAAAHSGVRVAWDRTGPVDLAQTPAELPRQREGADPVGPSTRD